MRVHKTLAVAAAVALGVVGCSNASQPAPDTSTSAAGACASTAGISDSTIKLGILSDLSGPIAAGGVPWSNGVEAFFAYANAELDDLGGRKVELVVKDTQYNPQKAIQAFRDLEGDIAGVPLSFGTAPTAALGGLVDSACMPVMANSGSAATQPAGIYGSYSTYEDATFSVLQYYIEDQSHAKPKVAVFYQGDSYGEGALKAVEYAASKGQLTVVGKASFAPTDQDFTGQLATIRAAKPDVVLMASTVGATFSFFGAAMAAGDSWDWLGLQPVFAPAVFALPISSDYQSKMTIAFSGPLYSDTGDQITAAKEWIAKEFPKMTNDPSALLGWQIGFEFYNALASAVKSGDTLNRGAIRDALANLDIASQGLGPANLVFSPSSEAPLFPYHDAAIVVPDSTVGGGLKIVKPFFEASLVESFYQDQP